MLIHTFSSCRIFLRKSGRSLRSWVQLLWSRLVTNKPFFPMSFMSKNWVRLFTTKTLLLSKKFHVWMHVTPSAFPANRSMTDFSSVFLPLNMNWANVQTCCQRVFFLSVGRIYAKYALQYALKNKTGLWNNKKKKNEWKKETSGGLHNRISTAGRTSL